SPATPLTAGAGPRAFGLDLLAGPLTAADLRGWALGMLAHPNPFGRAPDRWHPQRLLVEIDGRTVYDSEENPLDRRSLEAIRLIPPAHRDQDGQLLVNTPIGRETFVWEAGKGMGLDPDQGDPLPLPDPKDAMFPQPEVPPPVDAKPEPGEPEPKPDPKLPE